MNRMLTEGNEGNEAPARRFRGLNPTRLLNRAAVREFLLEQARLTRAHEFTRVSEETLIEINEVVRSHCAAIVRRLPSAGKTI